jgi:leader peptidase (prepilin peptidase) / N-methyltransferase
MPLQFNPPAIQLYLRNRSARHQANVLTASSRAPLLWFCSGRWAGIHAALAAQAVRRGRPHRMWPQVDVYSTSRMIRILGTIFAGLLGLAFGSFLNVCLSRWPEGESVVRPRSHCRNCDHTLSWWENIPLLSWLALRGRCRNCHAAISWRYPMVELTVGALWAVSWARNAQDLLRSPGSTAYFLFLMVASAVLFWLLVALAALDAEHLWLPNAITFPGIVLGMVYSAARELYPRTSNTGHRVLMALLSSLIAAFLAASLILFIRWFYWLVRRREGIGLGDAKLMALLGAWLGIPGALLAFGIGALLGAIVALVLLAVPAARRESESWAVTKLPLGTFLCIGGIVSSLWGQQVIAAYLRRVGL